MSATLTLPNNKTPRRRDLRRPAMVLVLAAILLLGLAIHYWPETVGKDPLPGAVSPASTFAPDPFGELRPELFTGQQRRALAESEGAPDPAPQTGTPAKPASPLDSAAALIKARKYEEAIRTLDGQRASLRQKPEAYVLLGRALEGRGDPATARDFYLKAIDMNPRQSDAYWGYATASETLGDLESAMGAMRSFLHTDPNPDPERLRIAQARSALWEWEAQLGRGPWGPSKGIMPGLTAEQQRRVPNKGMAAMMPIPGTEKADGSKQFEIVHRDKIQLFKPDK